MGDRIVWNTVHIKVPQEFITVGKNGAIKIKPPLTKTKKISSFNKEPAIQLEPANVEKVIIVEEGKKDTIENIKGRKKKEKEIEIKETAFMGMEDINRAETDAEKQKKKKEKEIEINENVSMGMEDINRVRKFKPMSTKIKTTLDVEPIIKNPMKTNISTSETMHERMARIRSYRKKKPTKKTI